MRNNSYICTSYRMVFFLAEANQPYRHIDKQKNLTMKHNL